MLSSAQPPALVPCSSATSCAIAAYCGTRAIACLFLAVLLPVILVSCAIVCLCTILQFCSRCRDVEDDQPTRSQSRVEVVCHLPSTDTSDISPICSPRLYGGSPASDVCSICLDELVQQVSIVKQLRCSHLFHCHCIDQWLASSQRCPLCLQLVATAQDIRRVSGNQQSVQLNASQLADSKTVEAPTVSS
jgi:hypothetical protein